MQNISRCNFSVADDIKAAIKEVVENEPGMAKVIAENPGVVKNPSFFKKAVNIIKEYNTKLAEWACAHPVAFGSIVSSIFLLGGYGWKMINKKRAGDKWNWKDDAVSNAYIEAGAGIAGLGAGAGALVGGLRNFSRYNFSEMDAIQAASADFMQNEPEVAKVVAENPEVVKDQSIFRKIVAKVKEYNDRYAKWVYEHPLAFGAIVGAMYYTGSVAGLHIAEKSGAKFDPLDRAEILGESLGASLLVGGAAAGGFEIGKRGAKIANKLAAEKIQKAAAAGKADLEAHLNFAAKATSKSAVESVRDALNSFIENEPGIADTIAKAPEILKDSNALKEIVDTAKEYNKSLGDWIKRNPLLFGTAVAAIVGAATKSGLGLIQKYNKHDLNDKEKLIEGAYSGAAGALAGAIAGGGAYLGKRLSNGASSNNFARRNYSSFNDIASKAKELGMLLKQKILNKEQVKKALAKLSESYAELRKNPEMMAYLAGLAGLSVGTIAGTANAIGAMKHPDLADAGLYGLGGVLTNRTHNKLMKEAMDKASEEKVNFSRPKQENYNHLKRLLGNNYITK